MAAPEVQVLCFVDIVLLRLRQRLFCGISKKSAFVKMS